MTPPALQRLIGRLDAAAEAPPQELPRRVTAALAESVAVNDWLPPEAQRASHDHYTRHLLYSDPGDRYSILAIAWGCAQQSPIHAHYTWCGVGIYRGELTETHYREEAAGRPPTALDACRRRAGELSFDLPLTGIHRIANLGSETAVSLHIYGIGRQKITTGVNRILG
jgi:3-mercaptopropionate dioxygenase